MLNWLLATIAAAVWSTAYGWYFSSDIRRWLWRRRNRRRLAEQQRAQAYAAWIRRTAAPLGSPTPRPPPPRPPPQRPSPPRPPPTRPPPQRPPRTGPAASPGEAAARPGGTVVPFPSRRRAPPGRD